MERERHGPTDNKVPADAVIFTMAKSKKYDKNIIIF